MRLKSLFTLFFITLFAYQAYSQCFQVNDGNGVASNNPYFISCTGGNFTVFIQTDIAIGPYTIDWGDGSAITSGASLTPPSVVQYTYMATTDTFNIVITDNGPNPSCVVNGVVVIERNPLASIQLPAGDDNFGCTPVQFRFVNSSTQISSTTVFEWDFGDGSPIQRFDSTNLGDTITHTYLPGIGTQSCNLDVVLTATNYCGSSNNTFSPLRVWDVDDAAITASATLLCFPENTVQYTNNTTRNCFPEGNTNQRYEKWNFGDYWGVGVDSIIDWRPWNPPIINPPPIAYPGLGFYTVTLIDSSFCGLDTATLTIQITNPPTAVLTSNRDTICEGESVTFSNASVGGANQYQWDFGQGAGFQNLNANDKIITYNTTGDYTIRIAVGVAGAQGCNDTAEVQLHVLPSPVANFNFDNNNVCDSMQVTFTNNSTGSISTYNWVFDNGNTFNGPNPPIQSYNAPGTYTVQLTVSSPEGCSNTISRDIRVRERPQAGFFVNTVCLNQNASFTDQSTDSLEPITAYKWYFGDGDSSSAQNPNHLYTAFGTYQVTQIVDNGFCMDTAFLNVVVENNPTAAFNADTLSGCSRLTVNLSNQSSINAVSFEWDFGDGSASVNARDTFHTFTNAGSTDTTFVIRLIAQTAFGCADTVYDSVQVFPVPIPSFTSDDTLDCGPVTVNFTNTTQGSNLNFRWNFGDGSPIVTTENPTHIYQNQTLFINNYEVSLIVESANGCRDTTRNTITVYPEPQFSFSAQPDSGCSPLNVSFPSVVGAVSYRWDFGDGDTDTANGPTPTHTFVNTTTNDRDYQVRLIARNSFGCLDTTFGDVRVFPSPTANFTLDTNVGCQPLPVSIVNSSIGANFFNWDFGDSTSSTSAAVPLIKTFTNTTLQTAFYRINLVVSTTRGCIDSIDRTVRVHPFISAAFNSDSVGCAPYKLRYNNASTGAAGYQWYFGDGDSSMAISPNHRFLDTITSTKNYRSRLITTSLQGCVDSAFRNITVYPKPIANFGISDNLGCHPFQVTFSDSSSLADSCTWLFGDTVVDINCLPSLQHTYTNTTSFLPIDYRSRLIVNTREGCADTAFNDIRVNPQIIADFEADSAACTPFSVNFRDQSQGAAFYQWSFGDGDSSQRINPRHLFENDRLIDTVFTTKLRVVSSYSCVDSISQTIRVYPKPIAGFVTDVGGGCHPLPITFSDTSELADSCIWTFGDGARVDSCFVQYQHIYTNTQSSVPLFRNARQIIFSNRLCSDTAVQRIRVNPDIRAAFNSDTAGCHPLRIRFNDNSSGADSVIWTFGDGASNVLRNPTHSFLNFTSRDTTFTTQMKVLSVYGCSDSVLLPITVYPKPTADFVVDTNEGCQPLRVSIENRSTIADNCLWIYGDGNQLSNCAQFTQHTYFNTLSIVPLDFTSQLIVSTNNGCDDTLSRNIRVKPQVIADFVSDTIGCSPLDIDFRSQSFGAISYHWDFGDGRLGNGIVTNNQYTNTGSQDSVYTARLIAQSVYDCYDTAFQDIRVRPTPIPDFVATPAFQVFPNRTVGFTNNTEAGNWNYVWDFGDSTTSILENPGAHQYATWGQYEISLTASSTFCSDVVRQLIEIDVPVPIAEFRDSASGCQPLTVSFINESIYGVDYEWDFGDGTSSTQENPTHEYFREGVYAVKLRAIGVGPKRKSDEILKQDYIRVFRRPTANFITNKDEVFVPNDPLVFANRSVNADSYFWDFGDGNTSTEQSPTHLYTTPGEYQVTLIAISVNGCSDTALAPNLILANLEGRIEVPNAFTPSANGPNGGNVNLNPGLGQINDVFYAKVSGTVKYELNIFNKWGELIFVSKDVNVGWDGYYRGELSKQDVYVWKVRAEFADGTSVQKVGELMLLR
ncbi:MAG: hypothetical protein CMO34_03500 [Verrucomicrobia bacterium]|nr:hypothetical protein [Verrucomicrobiota bacterium]